MQKVTVYCLGKNQPAPSATDAEVPDLHSTDYYHFL